MLLSLDLTGLSSLEPPWYVFLSYLFPPTFSFEKFQISYILCLDSLILNILPRWLSPLTSICVYILIHTYMASIYTYRIYILYSEIQICVLYSLIYIQIYISEPFESKTQTSWVFTSKYFSIYLLNIKIILSYMSTVPSSYLKMLTLIQ